VAQLVQYGTFPLQLAVSCLAREMFLSLEVGCCQQTEDYGRGQSRRTSQRSGGSWLLFTNCSRSEGAVSRLAREMHLKVPCAPTK